ncbi:VOC family protein [Luteipulveratus mongoliensis]|uniref:Putative pterin-4-alpha-carbinolamine dehydratase n=1 Tax=Luteipulveratus mongoliensis TaxID=571913 RepID=A0A0K1JGH6_9MICO|nr:VOC family protein [Luteipulveratus mongoliensis]AKU15817.1 pterin-4-alpha-carbinolamine dehydratase [Luteipulveratus mongoliensis]
MPTRVPAPEFATLGLDDWRYVAGTLEATFRLTSYAEAGAFASRVAAAADKLGHHPAINVRYPGVVHVVTTTHEIHAVSERDLALARKLSELAIGASVVSDPRASLVVELAIDALDIDAVRPFWKALLAYEDEPPWVEGDTIRAISDPRGVGPAVWFQQMDEPREQRNRIHFDVLMPHDVAEQRLADALAAGGHLVSDTRAKAFWILADAEGNEACICTWQDRE